MYTHADREGERRVRDGGASGTSKQSKIFDPGSKNKRDMYGCVVGGRSRHTFVSACVWEGS